MTLDGAKDVVENGNEEEKIEKKPGIISKITKTTFRIGPIKQEDLSTPELNKLMAMAQRFDISFDTVSILDSDQSDKLGHITLQFEIHTQEYLLVLYDRLSNLRLNPQRDVSVKFPAKFKKHIEEVRTTTAELRKQKIELAKKTVPDLLRSDPEEQQTPRIDRDKPRDDTKVRCQNTSVPLSQAPMIPALPSLTSRPSMPSSTSRPSLPSSSRLSLPSLTPRPLPLSASPCLSSMINVPPIQSSAVYLLPIQHSSAGNVITVQSTPTAYVPIQSQPTMQMIPQQPMSAPTQQPEPSQSTMYYRARRAQKIAASAPGAVKQNTRRRHHFTFTCGKCDQLRINDTHKQYFGQWYCQATATETYEEWRAPLENRRLEKKWLKEQQ